ncbi:MAG: hypothetical protein EBS05_12405 [Proteobacteria bacterium]|nr:hypothetical protein [Pseudomonadota bacterium]
MFAQAVIDYIAKNKIKHVVLAGVWPGASKDLADLVPTVRVLLDLGAKVYVLKDVPIPGFDVPRVVAITAKNGGNLEQLGVFKEKHKAVRRTQAKTFDLLSQMGATVLDPFPLFLNQHAVYAVVKNGEVLYCDDNHLSVEGARLLVPLFGPIFEGK